MHGAGHWVSFGTWNTGGTVVVQSAPERLDPVDIWSLIEREQVDFLLIVGDAFARPLLDELDRRTYDLSSLTVLLSGGAPLSARLKREFLEHLPTLMIIDGLGSSEAGGQLSSVSTSGSATTGTFPGAPGNDVLAYALDRVLEPGDEELGWLAKTRPARPRLPGRRGTDHADLPADRRHPLRGPRRPRPSCRRRPDRAART